MMKQSEVEIGASYRAKVSGQIVNVRIEKECEYGGWWARSLASNRRVRIRSAQRLREKVA